MKKQITLVLYSSECGDFYHMLSDAYKDNKDLVEKIRKQTYESINMVEFSRPFYEDKQ